MLAKISAALYLLVVVCSVPYSTSCVTCRTEKPGAKTFLELHDEAQQACVPDISIYLNETFFFNIPREKSPSRYYCPLLCYAKKLGIVNEDGFNKLILDWRLRWTEEDVYDVKQEDNNFYYTFKKFVNEMEDVCSAKYELTRDNRFRKSFKTFIEELLLKRNLTTFIPSEKDSPILELIRNAMDTCSLKFNGTSFFNRSSSASKSHQCQIHCILTELELVNEKGWNGATFDMIREIGDQAASIDDEIKKNMAFYDKVILMDSKCPDHYNELPDNYFGRAEAEIGFMGLSPEQRSYCNLTENTIHCENSTATTYFPSPI